MMPFRYADNPAGRTISYGRRAGSGATFTPRKCEPRGSLGRAVNDPLSLRTNSD